MQGWLFQRDEGIFFGAVWSGREEGGEGVGSDDGGRAFGAQSAPNHWAERGKGRVTGVLVFVQVLVCKCADMDLSCRNEQNMEQLYLLCACEI